MKRKLNEDQINNLISTTGKARENHEAFVKKVEEMEAAYTPGGVYGPEMGIENEGLSYSGYYSFNLFNFFTQQEIDNLLSQGSLEDVNLLFAKTERLYDKTDRHFIDGAFDSIFGTKIVEIWPEETLKKFICDKIPTRRDRYSLPRHFEQAVVATGKHDLIMLLLDKSFTLGMSEPGQQAVFKRDNETEIFYLLSQAHLAKTAIYDCPELTLFQYKIVNSGDKAKIRRLIECCKPANEVQVWLYNCGLTDMYQLLLETWGVCQELQMIAMQKEDKTMLKGILDKHALAPYGATEYFIQNLSDEWFDYYILTKRYRFDDDAEIILLKQNNEARIFRYIDCGKGGLSYRAKDYVLQEKQRQYCRRLLDKGTYFTGSDFKDFLTFAEEEDILVNLKNIGRFGRDEEKKLSIARLENSDLLVQAVEFCGDHPDYVKKIIERNNFDEVKSAVCHCYHCDYDRLIFSYSDIDMFKAWLNRQYDSKEVPAFVDFTRLNKEAVRFLIDYCHFPAEVEARFYEECFQPEVEYYLQKHYPGVKI